MNVLQEFLLPRFETSQKHAQFFRVHDERKFVMRRFFMFFGVIAFAFHAIMDFLVGQDAAAQLLLIRALASCGMLMFALYFANHRYRSMSDSMVIAIYLAIGTIGVLVMCTTIKGVPAGIYPLGLFVVLAFGGVVLSLPTAHTATSAVLTYVAYWAVVPIIELPEFALPVIAFLLTISFVAIMAGALVHERGARLQWLAECEILESKERLEDLNAELVASKQEAIEARDEAINARNTQSDFIASMSHELRTPLNAVIGFSELIKTEPFGPVEKRYVDYLTDIETAGRNLLTHVNDLLDLKRLSSGKMSWSASYFNLHEVLQSACNLCKIEGENAGVRIHMRPSDTGTMIYGDKDRLIQALVNVMNNGIKASDNGQTLMLESTYRSSGDVAISVVDRGCGISETDLEKIIEPFKQVGNGSAAITNEGLGVGLSIVGGIVECFGAKLEMQSKLGDGTTVTIVLPADSARYDVAGANVQAIV